MILSSLLAVLLLLVFTVIPISSAFSSSSNRPSSTNQQQSYNVNDDVHITSMKMTSKSLDEDSTKIRFLGSGEDAIIRPGVVLVAPKHEYDHFLMKSASFVYAIGLNERDDMVIRAVVLDNPTAFTIGEMSPNIMGSISDNILFRGGYDGRDSAMLLHSAGGSNGHVKSDNEIGSSGMYEGGIVSAMEAADAKLIEPDQCKFFFNYMQFTEKEIENMFAEVEDGDAWVSCEVPTEYILDSNYDRGQLWSKLRNEIRNISP